MNSAIILLSLGGIILTIGDVFMKKWVEAGGYGMYVIGLLTYFLGLNFLAQSFQFKNIAVASVMLVIFNVVTLSFVSWLYFKETLTSFQILGIMLGITSIVVLEFST